MRWCVALLFIIPVVSGQAVFEDPAGDQEAGYYLGHWDDEPVAWMETEEQGWYRYADVVRAGILEETETDLVFLLEMAAWAAAGEPSEHDYIQVEMPFTLRGQDMQATFRYWMDDGAGFITVGIVEQIPFGSGTFTRVTNAVGAPLEMTDDGLVGRIQKESIRDQQMVPVRAGDVLEGITVVAEPLHSSRSSPCVVNNAPNCWRARDVVEGSKDLTIEKNPPGVGHLFIESKAPYRGSNGAATTYLFNVTLRNLGDVDDRVTVQIGGQPSDWVVRAPTTLQVPAQQEVTVPVAVSVPFKHVHGEVETLEVRTASTAVPGIEAVQELGVVWHEVPQPGGHHDTLFLHSNEGRGWMNALADDPDAQPDSLIEWNSWSSGVDENRLGYAIHMSPGLLMGLDFSPGQDIQLELPIESSTAMEARLVVKVRDSQADPRVVAKGAWDVSLDEGTNRQSLTMALEPGIDRFPYMPGGNLVMDVELFYNATSTGPGVLPFTAAQADHAISTDGAYMRLPLQEYHDIIDTDLLASLGRLSLRAEAEVERLVNPAKVAAVAFAASNAGSRTATVDWHVEGTNAHWAAVIPDASVIGPQANATVVVTVMPPAGAADGDVAQLLLIGQDRRDPDAQIFARLVVTVTTTADIPDEADQAKDLASQARESEAKKSPGFGLVALLAAVGLALRRWQ